MLTVTLNLTSIHVVEDVDQPKFSTSFQALFLHDRLITHLLDPRTRETTEGHIHRAKETTPPDESAYTYAFERVLPLVFAKASELSVLYVKRESLDGRLVTLTQDFYFKDLGNGRRRFHGQLDVNRDVAVHGEFSSSRTIGSTGDTTLSGHDRVCVLARVLSASDAEIRLQPLFMGFQFFDREGESLDQLIESQLEVFVEQIEEFKKARETEVATNEELKTMKTIPESRVKEAFANIIGEPFIPKDWGGERSDLFTSRLTLGQVRTTAAFAFKGPAVKGNLTIAKMGKNGDQALRLAEEPAGILVVQHHSYVAQAVRRLMQAIARDNGKRFMILDGADTARILRAYGRLSDE